MKVLFFVEPLALHGRPFHYWAWLGFHADMARALAGAGCEVRVAVNRALEQRALAERGVGDDPTRRGHGLPAGDVVAFDQEPIRRIFELPNIAILEGIQRRTHPAERMQAYAALVRSTLGDFEPEVILSLSPADQLKVAYPAATLLITETAAYSRSPFPFSIFFDPRGLWERSVPATHAAELLARPASAAEASLLAAMRARFGAYFAATTPFAALEAELRREHRAIGLLPLQFGGEPGFDLNAPFRNQGEYLFHVLEQTPRDVALIVVEHPTAHWLGDIIDGETREDLAARYPNLRFVDYHVADSAGQRLVHHADFVISISSSLGYQALYFEKPLIAVGNSQLRPYAAGGLELLAAPLPRPDPAIDNALAWLTTHYWVPLELAGQASWLLPTLERARNSAPGLDLFVPIPGLDASLFGDLEGLSASPLRAALKNGDFGRWTWGEGPFPVGLEGPNGWHLLDYEDGRAEVVRAGKAASITREHAGRGSTLFLQRIPDATATAGAPVRLTFRARSADRAGLTVYLFLQIDDGQPGAGTALRLFELGPDWQEHAYTAIVPSLGERVSGPRSHLEVVFSLTPEEGATSFELAEVRLEPFAF